MTRLSPSFLFVVLVVLSLWLTIAAESSEAASSTEEDERVGNSKIEGSWQNCETFLGPSSLPTGGWGVYAARGFEPNEVVDISPRFVALPYDTPVVQRSVVNDYIYGVLRWNTDRNEFDDMAGVIFGNAMFYNHHGVEPNVLWVSYGREPIAGVEPDIAMTNGFVARRKIEAGEELFSSYGEEDGGKAWFADRGLEQATIPAHLSRKNGTVYEKDKQKYCSKIYAGMGQPTWDNRVVPSHYEFPYTMNSAERLAPVDHPFAVLKQDVTAGTVLEVVPALVVSKDKIINTPLAPMGFFWDEWDDAQKKSIAALREAGELLVQHQDQSTDWEREDHFDAFENAVVLPAAGNIALVHRFGQGKDVEESSSANCVLNIISSGSMKSHENHGGTSGSAGMLLQLVATRDLKTGERLTLSIPSHANPLENQLLAEALKRSGQPVPEFLESIDLTVHRDEL